MLVKIPSEDGQSSSKYVKDNWMSTLSITLDGVIKFYIIFTSVAEVPCCKLGPAVQTEIFNLWLSLLGKVICYNVAFVYPSVTCELGFAVRRKCQSGRPPSAYFIFQIYWRLSVIFDKRKKYSSGILITQYSINSVKEHMWTFLHIVNSVKLLFE
jgi:hypothetical protein